MTYKLDFGTGRNSYRHGLCLCTVLMASRYSALGRNVREDFGPEVTLHSVRMNRALGPARARRGRPHAPACRPAEGRKYPIGHPEADRRDKSYTGLSPGRWASGAVG